ncbi:kinase-like domain-containing protein [Powellomyces hirtus]|nr:kinase-like domain-containing protein [Powellomyces hirtus]
MTRVAPGSSLPPTTPPPPSLSKQFNGSIEAMTDQHHGSDSAGSISTLYPAPFTTRQGSDSFDIVEKKKAAQHSENQQAAIDFLENTIGRRLPNESLYVSLRNGVILCELINKLRPGSIRVISTRDAPFLQMENINRFLTASKNLGLKGHELFQTVDLFEGKEMQQVIVTILTIARVIAGAPLKSRPPDQVNPYRDNVIIHDPVAIDEPIIAHEPVPSTTPTSPPKFPSLPPAPYLHTKSASASQFSTPSLPGAEPSPIETDKPVPKTPGSKLKKSESDVAVRSPRRRTESPHRSRPSTASGSVRSAKGLMEKVVVGNYQLGSGIGKGQFGAVYQALNIETGQIAAIKRIPLADRKEQGVQDLMQEVELLKSLAHPNIVKYLGFMLQEGYLNIILEFMECGSLQTVMKKYGLLIPEKLAAVYSEDILRGLVYLHDQGVVHCDLKCANILTTKDSNVKLSDFGVSKVLNGVGEDEGAIAGTPYWMAPEIIELKGASTASDIWSLGCTVIEMITGKPPYLDLKNPMTALFRIVEDESPPLPADISPELRDFFSLCFQRDVSKRATARDLLNHEWIIKKYKGFSVGCADCRRKPQTAGSRRQNHTRERSSNITDCANKACRSGRTGCCKSI